MCRAHWRMVPPELRRDVWATYREGQEQGKATPSRAWHRAADAALEHVAQLEADRASSSPQTELFR